jgi:hypothetical protein
MVWLIFVGLVVLSEVGDLGIQTNTAIETLINDEIVLIPASDSIKKSQLESLISTV